MKTVNYDNLFQFLKFCLVGLSNTIVYLAIYYALVFIGVYYLMANFIGFVISVFNAYYWNKRHVFSNSKASSASTIMKTYVSYGITTLISSFLLYQLVELFSVPKVIAPIITLVVTIPLNFILNKYWTFES